MNILLVEDSNVDAVLFQAHLKKYHSRFNVHRTENLSDGLDYLQIADVDVILLDLNLPDSAGINTFIEVHRRVPQIPIIVLSGQDDAELAVAAVSDGAQDYLPKSEATASSLSRSIQYAIERSHRQRVEREISAAGEIQRRLFPQNAPVHQSLEVHGRCEPANLAGGDYFDYFDLRNGNQAIVIADVSGHGVGPALIMAQTRTILRSLATTIDDLGCILTRANQILADDVDDDVFVSLLLLSINTFKPTLSFASAGHPALILDQQGQPKVKLKSQDPPLCVVPDHEFATSDIIDLASGDAVVLFTDGITEAMDTDQNQYGEEKMLHEIRLQNSSSCKEIIDHVFECVQKHSQATPHQDDMTAVMVRIY